MNGGVGGGAVNRNRMALVQEGKKLRGLKKKKKKNQVKRQ